MKTHEETKKILEETLGHEVKVVDGKFYLREENLSDADLSDTNLRGADLCDATLIDTNFIGADLIGACFSGAYLSRTKLTIEQCNSTIGLPQIIEEKDNVS